jgi:hypothetical protein
MLAETGFPSITLSIFPSLTEFQQESKIFYYKTIIYRKQSKVRDKVPRRQEERKQKMPLPGPSTKNGGRDRDEPVRPTPTSSHSDPKKSKGARRPSVTGDDKSKSNPGPSKHNIQVVYKPPFSVKVEMIPQAEPAKPSAPTQVKSSRTSGESKVRTPGTVPPSSPSGSSGGTKPKVSTSLLRRRKSKASSSSKYPKNLGKSELQILIPKTQEEDDSVTPQPLTS